MFDLCTSEDVMNVSTFADKVFPEVIILSGPCEGSILMDSI